MQGAKIKIGEIRQALENFARKQKEWQKFPRGELHSTGGEINEVAIDLRLRYRAISQLSETGEVVLRSAI